MYKTYKKARELIKYARIDIFFKFLCISHKLKQ